MSGQGNKKEKSFEAALKRLEEIVSEMERGELSLDVMLKKFDEGMRLAQFCSKKLEEAEKKIEVLVKKDDGTFETRDFPSPEEAALNSEEGGESLTPDEEDEEPLF